MPVYSQFSNIKPAGSNKQIPMKITRYDMKFRLKNILTFLVDFIEFKKSQNKKAKFHKIIISVKKKYY